MPAKAVTFVSGSTELYSRKIFLARKAGHSLVPNWKNS